MFDLLNMSQDISISPVNERALRIRCFPSLYGLYRLAAKGSMQFLEETHDVAMHQL